MNCPNQEPHHSDRDLVRLKAAKALAVLLAVCVWISAPHEASASMVAAELLPDSGYNFGGTIGLNGARNTAHGQTFLAEQGGPLESITVRISGRAGSQEPLLVRLHALSGALPGDLLDSRSVAAALVSTTSSTNVTVDFSGSPATLVAGEAYAVVLGVDEPLDGGRYGWGGVLGNAYPQGHRVQSGDGGGSFSGPFTSDFGFRVMVVPEPMSVGLLVLGAAAMIARGRKRS